MASQSVKSTWETLSRSSRFQTSVQYLTIDKTLRSQPFAINFCMAREAYSIALYPKA